MLTVPSPPLSPSLYLSGAIVDKNARIGRMCKIVNVEGVEESFNEDKGWVIRDGVIVVMKDAQLRDGTVI